MTASKFIEKMIELISYPEPRLRNPGIQLSILVELHTPQIQDIVNLLLSKKDYYKRTWDNMLITGSFDDDIILLHISNLKAKILAKGVMSLEESNWIDDAVHEILTGDF
jgi:hypothetical protein